MRSESSGKRRRTKRIVKVLLWSLLAIVVTANLMAYLQVRSMTHFTSATSQTEAPEKLSLMQKIGVLFAGTSFPRPMLDRTPWDVGLDFSSFRVTVDSETTLDCWDIPCSVCNGTVILFHGYGAAKSDLLDEAKAIRGMGYACWLVDFRGSGSSTGDKTSIGYYEADDVAAVCREYRKRDTLPLFLYGNSMGAASIVRAVAVCGVRPDGIILESVFDRMLTTVENRFRIMGLPSFPLANLMVFWGGVDQGFNAFSNNPMDFARQVRCPALVFHGAQDRRATLNDCKRVFDNLAGPKELIVFENAAHQSGLSADAAKWKKEVWDFLGKNAGK